MVSMLLLIYLFYLYVEYGVNAWKFHMDPLGQPLILFHIRHWKFAIKWNGGSININLLLYFRKTSNFRIIFSHVHFWFIEWKVLWHSYLYSFGWAYFRFLNRIFSFLKHFLFQGTTILWHDKQNKLMKINSSKHILEQGGKKRKKKKKEIIGNSYCIML